MSAQCNVVVLISGSGSNLQALIDSIAHDGNPARIAAVISNRADAYGLERAKQAGIATAVLDHKQFDGREAFDAALVEAIDAFAPQLVVLAGFMRILTPGFVRHYTGRLLNIHPSLLPKGAQAVVDVASWTRPAVFDWLQEKGNVDEHEMHRVLNCGVGMVICVAQDQVDITLQTLTAAGEQPWVIGQIGTAAEGAAQVVLNNLKQH